MSLAIWSLEKIASTTHINGARELMHMTGYVFFCGSLIFFFFFILSEVHSLLLNFRFFFV